MNNRVVYIHINLNVTVLDTKICAIKWGNITYRLESEAALKRVSFLWSFYPTFLHSKWALTSCKYYFVSVAVISLVLKVVWKRNFLLFISSCFGDLWPLHCGMWKSFSEVAFHAWVELSFQVHKWSYLSPKGQICGAILGQWQKD